MYSIEQGIGIELGLEPTPQTRRFLNDLPRGLGEPVDPEKFHTTVMYPEELARAGLGGPEKEKLADTANDIMRRLGDMCIIGSKLKTVKDLLVPYKKFLAIELLDETNVCNDVRAVASRVTNENLGVTLRTYLDNHHASVTERRRKDGSRRPIVYTRRFPTEFIVRQCTVGVRSVGFTTDGQPQNYVNCLYQTRR